MLKLALGIAGNCRDGDDQGPRGQRAGHVRSWVEAAQQPHWQWQAGEGKRPHIYDAYIHMYTYIQTYTVASTVSLFTLASLLSMVKHGYNNIDCMHRFPPCARSLRRQAQCSAYPCVAHQIASMIHEARRRTAEEEGRQAEAIEH